MVECLTRDRVVAGSSLAGGIALCLRARHFILSLVLVQHRKTHPHMIEKLLIGSKQTEKNKVLIFALCAHNNLGKYYGPVHMISVLITFVQCLY